MEAGGRETIIPDASPFADIAARDTWAAANFSELVNSTTQVTEVVVAGDVYRWGGDALPYDGNNWLIANETLNATEVQTLYESNPDTERFTTSFRTAAQSIQNGEVGNVPMFSASGFADSPLTVEAEQINSLMPVAGPSGGAQVLGNLMVSNGGSALLVEDQATGVQFFPVFMFLTPNGTTRTTREALAPPTDTPAAATPTQTFQGATLQFALPNTNRGTAEQYTFTIPAGAPEVTDCNFTIRAVSHTNNPALFDYKESSGDTGFTFPANTTGSDITFTLPLPRPAFFVENQLIYVTMTAGQGQELRLRGQTLDLSAAGLGNQDIPTIAVRGRLSTQTWVADSLDIANALNNGTHSNISFSSSVNPLNGDLTINATAQNDNTQRTNEDIRDVVGSTLVAGSNVTITVDDAADTITISSTGGGGGGTNPPADADRIYYGLASSSDTTAIDVTTLTRENDPTDPDTISSGAATAGQYFVLYVPMTHDITSITDTVLQQDVTDLFTSLDNAQTVDTIAFKSYIIGPLNAGFDETYVVRF